MGTIDGGLRANVVAPHSLAVVDVRVATATDAELIESSILNINPAIPGTALQIEGGFGRPVMEKTAANRDLWRLARRLGTELGIQISDGTAGGGSDGNTTSLYTATLDGLGAVGGGAHAHHEHLNIGKSLQRAALLTLLLMQGKLEPSGADYCI